METKFSPTAAFDAATFALAEAIKTSIIYPCNYAANVLPLIACAFDESYNISMIDRLDDGDHDFVFTKNGKVITPIGKDFIFTSYLMEKGILPKFIIEPVLLRMARDINDLFTSFGLHALEISFLITIQKYFITDLNYQPFKENGQIRYHEKLDTETSLKMYEIIEAGFDHLTGINPEYQECFNRFNEIYFEI